MHYWRLNKVKLKPHNIYLVNVLVFTWDTHTIIKKSSHEFHLQKQLKTENAHPDEELNKSNTWQISFGI